MSERAVYWRRMLSEWERSGLSQAEFCRRRGIKAVTLAWWRRRLREDAGGGVWKRQVRGGRRSMIGGRGGFVEVALPRGVDGAPASGGYELLLPGGVGLRLPDDFDPARVAQLVQALVAAC
jgi:hypothetical protein